MMDPSQLAQKAKKSFEEHYGGIIDGEFKVRLFKTKNGEAILVFTEEKEQRKIPRMWDGFQMFPVLVEVSKRSRP